LDLFISENLIKDPMTEQTDSDSSIDDIER